MAAASTSVSKDRESIVSSHLAETPQSTIGKCITKLQSLTGVEEAELRGETISSCLESLVNLVTNLLKSLQECQKQLAALEISTTKPISVESGQGTGSEKKIILNPGGAANAPGKTTVAETMRNRRN